MNAFRHKGGGAGPQAFDHHHKAGYRVVKTNEGKHLRSIHLSDK